MNEWIEKFERAGVVGRLGLLAGGAVRLAASAAELAIDRAASITAEAQMAFRKEMDPNVSDARILEETTGRGAPAGEESPGKRDP